LGNNANSFFQQYWDLIGYKLELDKAKLRTLLLLFYRSQMTDNVIDTHSFFVYNFGVAECAGHSFAYVAPSFEGNEWIRTHRASLASKRVSYKLSHQLSHPYLCIEKFCVEYDP
jgi:hypothetical protein